MKKKIFFLLSVLPLLISCSGERKTLDNNDELIYVKLENFSQMEGVESLSSIASDITYIPLETSEYSLLGDISRIVCLGNSYLISDVDNIYLFNDEGKFIKNIAQKGQGPSDYTAGVNNIIIDSSTKKFYLFSVDKVIVFDENGDFLRNFIVESTEKGVYNVYQSGMFTDNRTLMLGLLNRVKIHGDTTISYNLKEVDTLGNIVSKYINYSPRYAQSRLGQVSYNSAIYEFNGKIRFMDFGNDTIFSIINGHMIPYAICDLGKSKTNLIIDNSTNKNTYPDGYYVRKVIENEDFLFFELKDANSMLFLNCLYNKKTNDFKVLKGNGMLNDLDGGVSFFPQKSLNSNELIGWKSAEEFKEEILSKNYNENAKYGERFERVYQLAKSLKDDDNPVLIITRK